MQLEGMFPNIGIYAPSYCGGKAMDRVNVLGHHSAYLWTGEGERFMLMFFLLGKSLGRWQ